MMWNNKVVVSQERMEYEITEFMETRAIKELMYGRIRWVFGKHSEEGIDRLYESLARLTGEHIKMVMYGTAYGTSCREVATCAFLACLSYNLSECYSTLKEYVAKDKDNASYTSLSLQSYFVPVITFKLLEHLGIISNNCELVQLVNYDVDEGEYDEEDPNEDYDDIWED